MTGLRVERGKFVRAIDIFIGTIGVLIIAGYLIFRPEPSINTKSNSKNEELIIEVPDIETIDLSSTHALLVDVENNQVLLNIKGDDLMYPASITKIMTALIAIEELDNLTELVYVDGEMFPELDAQSASRAGFVAGEWVTAIELLYGIMLPSGAESTLAIAHAVAGSEEKFVQMMNQKARELEMSNTHFMNPIGLHHPNHYTTAKDMVTLLNYALTNETFRLLFETPVYTTSSGLTFESTMFKNLPQTELNQGRIIGGRTGFTLEAGRCLISLAKINDKEYILVTGGAINTPENQIQHLLDAIYIFDQL